MYGEKWPDPMDFRRILKAVFQPVPTRKHRQLVGIHRKQSEQLPSGILLPFPRYFRCFPTAYGNFPTSFLQDLAGFGGRNLQLGLSSILEQVNTDSRIPENGKLARILSPRFYNVQVLKKRKAQ
jgi:hypothetical protein